MVTVPVGLGLALVAEPLTLLLFSDKWIEAVPVMRAIAIQTTVLSLSFNLGTIYKAQGKNHVLISIILVRIVVLLPALWWAVRGPGTIVAVAWVHAAVALFIVLLDLLVAVVMLNLAPGPLLRAFVPAIACGAVMLCAGTGMNLLLRTTPPLLELALLVTCGATVYTLILYWFERDAFALVNNRLRATLQRG